MLSIFCGLLLAVSISYSPPVDYEVVLAGNFGEPRPNHFHGGIDVKTGGVKGKPVYSIADGYVSRITVGLFGFGNAVYITHPDGNTSIYCHLETFSPRIKNMLKRAQLKQETNAMDVTLEPTDCPVTEGQFIAISGNSGASTAPHLHLELHDTRTWRMKDPLDYLGDFVADSTPPRAHAVKAYPVKGKGMFNGRTTRSIFALTSKVISHHFTAWGLVGFGIWANDYGDEAYNPMGVRQMVLKVDGMEVFYINVNDIPVQSNRMVNVWGDYNHFATYKKWYMKSFVVPGNRLPIIAKNRGFIDFNEERDYQLEYVLTDAFGNTSTYKFTVTGKRTDISKIASQTDSNKQKKDTMVTARKRLYCDKMNTFTTENVRLVIPQGRLPMDVTLQAKTKRMNKQSNPSAKQNISPLAYTFYGSEMPLLQSAELSLYTDYVEDTTKVYISRHDGRFVGGTYSNGWVTTSIRDLGAYYHVDYDDVPPEIMPVQESAWNRTATITFKVTDKHSGVKIYRGYIDGEFVRFEKMNKSSLVTCKLKNSHVVSTGGKHHLRFEAIDYKDNIDVYETDIVY